MRMLGRHILVEFYGCIASVLNDSHSIQASMEEAAVKSNATIVNSVFHHFSPHGVSGVVVIAESHFAVHTWPEHRYAAVDLFTCGSRLDPWKAFDLLKSRLGAVRFTTREIQRGLPEPDADSNFSAHFSHKPEIML